MHTSSTMAPVLTEVPASMTDSAIVTPYRGFSLAVTQCNCFYSKLDRKARRTIPCATAVQGLSVVPLVHHFESTSASIGTSRLPSQVVAIRFKMRPGIDDSSRLWSTLRCMQRLM